MLYKIDSESIKKLQNIPALLNELEVKGASNIQVMYNLFGLSQSILQEIDAANKIENKPINLEKEGK